MAVKECEECGQKALVLDDGKCARCQRRDRGLPVGQPPIATKTAAGGATNPISIDTFRAAGFTKPQSDILNVIATKPGITPADIAAKLKRSPASVSKSITDLSNAGAVDVQVVFQPKKHYRVFLAPHSITKALNKKAEDLRRAANAIEKAANRT